MPASALFLGLLAFGWGAVFGVRPVLAYGIAHLTVWLLLYLYPRVAQRGLSLTRHQSETACEEDAVRVEFTLHQSGLLPLFAPEVLDRFTPDRIDPRRARVYPGLGPRGSARVGYRGVCHGRRGSYLIGPARVRITCPVGLFALEWTAPGELAPLLVYPGLERVAAPTLAFRGRAPSVGARSPREAGQGEVPLGVRDYRPGDGLRRVHWPTLARRGQLAVIEHERERSRRTSLVLDLCRQSLRGLGRQANLEVALRTLAAVGAACLERGDRVGLVAEGREALCVPPGRGDAQLCRLLEALTHVRAEGELRLPAFLERLAPRFYPGELVYVAVSDLELDGRALLEAFDHVLARGCAIQVALLDPATFPPLHELPSERATLEEVAEGCFRRGILPFALKAAQPLGEALSAPWSARPKIRLTPASLAGSSRSAPGLAGVAPDG